MSKVLWQSGVYWEGHYSSPYGEEPERVTGGGPTSRKSALQSARRWRRAHGQTAGYTVWSERFGHAGIDREIIAQF